jgi:choline dehydrogenase-like flavoprotein
MIAQDDAAIVIIGSGAGGGTVADVLTAGGFPVVLLEAGPRIQPEAFHQNDLAAFAQLSWLEPRTASGTFPAAQGGQPPSWTVRAVGGATLHWNGLAYRPQAHELRARDHYGAIAGASLADWPMSLADLAPALAEAERRLGVSGTGGRPVHGYSNQYRLLWNGARRLGYRRISNAGIAINVAEADGRPGCIAMGFCNQGCRISAKWSTLAAEIPRAERTGRLDLRPDSHAVRIEHGADGRASAVIYADAKGALQRQAAAQVVVACNAIETARLLLLSESARFPRGLANGSDQVGRNYMRHTTDFAIAELPNPVHMERGITTPGTVFDEDIHAPERGFSGGYLMEAAALAPASLALILDPLAWGRSLSGFVERYAHLGAMLMNGEELPVASNRVTLDPAVKDGRGLAVAHVHVTEHAETGRMRDHFRRQSAALYRAVGATEVRHATPGSATHNMGTARMAADPANGVVDAFGRAHEVSNLWIADGSVFPSSLSVNPTLTIVAHALRLADRLAMALKRG